MAVDLAYPHVKKDGAEPARLERLPRVRIAQIVMDYLAHGWSVEEMCRQHPHLRLAEAYEAMAYYFDHQDEIDAEIAAELKEVEQFASAPPSPFLQQLRARGIR